MQTYLVHSLTPLRFLREVGWKAFFGFHILVGGMILTALLHTVFIGSLAARLIVEGPGGFLPVDIWDAVSIVVLLVGYPPAAASVTTIGTALRGTLARSTPRRHGRRPRGRQPSSDTR